MKKIIFVVVIYLFSISGVSAKAATRVIPKALHSYASAVQRAIASVVQVRVRRVVIKYKKGKRYTTRSGVSGSGIVVRSNGYIGTNYHNVKGAVLIKVQLYNGDVFPAKLVAFDPDTDIAVIKIKKAALRVIEFEDSNDIKVGDVVLAIGSPFSLGKTVTQGIISAIGRRGVRLNQLEQYIQTDAAINPGNSGGALINTRGLLVGMNTGLYSKSGGFQGYAFAIPSNIFTHVVNELIQYGKVLRGGLGLDLITVYPPLVERYKLKVPRGAMVLGYLKTARDKIKSRIQKRDVITSINGGRVSSARQVINYVAQQPIGKVVRLRINRSGSEISVSAVVRRQSLLSSKSKQQLQLMPDYLPDSRHHD